MSKEHKKPRIQTIKPERKKQNIVLSENRSVKYKIVKIQQNAVIRKKKTDTASTAVQSQKQTDKKPENIQKAVNINSKSRRKSISNKTAAPENNSGDKYKETVKRAEVQKQFRTESSAPKTPDIKSDYSLKSKETVKRTEDFVQKGTEERKRKAAEINNKLKAEVIKARTETQSLENDLKSYAVENAKKAHMVKHLKKGNVDSERFRKAVNNTIKKQIHRDSDCGKYKSEAALHYKKSLSYAVKGKKIEKRLEKAEKKAARNEKILAAGKAAAVVLTKPEQAGKQIIEDQIRKSKLGNAILNINNDLQTINNAAEANSLGEGTANVVMALPEKYVKNSVKNTVAKTLTGRGKADRLGKKKKRIDRKYGAEQAKVERAERKARRAKDSAIRKAKVQFYKEEKGLTKSQSIIKNIKNGISHAAAGIGKLAIESGKNAIVAIISALGPTVILFLSIIAVISALFSWIIPHEETFYIEDTNTWEPVMVGTDEEILKGYLRHIGDYFDKKQLEILEVVDINFDGFAPDKYDYTHVEDRGDVMNFENMPKLSTEYTVYYISRTYAYKTVTGVIPGDRYNQAKPIWSDPIEVTESAPENPVLRMEYYKFDNDLGYEIRTMSVNYDFTRTYVLCGLDIEAYLNSKAEEDPITHKVPLYSCENGVFARNQDITDEVMTLRKDGVTVYSGSVPGYLMANPEIFEHTVPLHIPSGGEQCSDKSEWRQQTEAEIMDDGQYVFDNYIWNLNEYGNRWIKLSDDCDYESIIAMAAIKKWQEIESDGFDSSTYSFEITEEDLKYCLDSLFTVTYGYTSGRCTGDDCHCYTTGDPPHKEYTCNRALTHKHLRGQVANLEVAGGIDYVLNRILKVPVPSDYSSDVEYQKAKSQFETDKEIYEVYREYIKNELGTSTKLPDYEHNREAQYRLLRMHQAGYGKKPSNPPTNVSVSCSKKAVDLPPSTGYRSYDIEEHYYLNVTWDPPAAEEYAKGKFVEINGYNVYAYDRSKGTKKLLMQVSGTSANNIDFGVGNYGSSESITREDGTILRKRLSGPTFTYIIVEAYNDGGSGPQSKPVYVIMK